MPETTASTTLICDGFTAAGFLDGTKLSLTSYSASHHKKLMQSNAVWKHATSVNSVRRMKGPYIQDVPTISCEITFEPELSLLQTIINKLITARNSVFKVGIKDHSSGINWIFDKCYVQSFSFDVSINSILAASASFFVVPEYVSYVWSDRANNAYGSDNLLPITTPIPYYAWKLSDANSEIKDISEFSFSLNQTITPKYSCSGNQSLLPPAATHLLFGLPTIEFGMTRLMTKSGSIDFSSDMGFTNHKSKIEMDTDKISFAVRENVLFELTGLTEIEKTPTFEGVPAMRTTYSVNGILKNSDSSDSQ